jgi:2-(1,2-epoxy-1,2-dihydrophenyl)acetyl-CoA isomerase
VGLAAATDLLVSGRTFLADEALRLGLVSELADDVLPAALELAYRIAENPPLATQAIKAGLRQAAGMGRDDLDDLARTVGHNLHRLFASEDHKAAVMAFMTKQPATFHGR